MTLASFSLTLTYLLNCMDEYFKKHVCHHCVSETYLSNEIEKNGLRKKCSYCPKAGKAYSLKLLSEKVQDVFSRFYQRTPTEPTDIQSAMIAAEDSSYIWVREGTPVALLIEEVAGVSTEIASDIREVLSFWHYNRSAAEIQEECEFDDESKYEYVGRSIEKWENNWDKYEKSLKEESRFFNSFGQKLLMKIFHGIEHFKTHRRKPVVVAVGPKRRLKAIFRARVFQSYESLEAALASVVGHLGPPPSSMARGGRMNANGISVFYGADSSAAAIAETRPPVGSKVVVAQFRFLRNLRLLDLKSLEDLKPVTSEFDPAHSDELEKIGFLRQLCKRITVPIMPTEEDSGYLSTQAISDFLATSKSLNLDGIIYPSIQSGKHSNIVLFFKSSRVENRSLPPGTEVNVILESFDESGPYDDYIVFEETLSLDEQKKVQQLKSQQHLWREDEDLRPYSLKINEGAITVHAISKAEYSYESHSVLFHRSKKINYDDLEDV